MLDEHGKPKKDGNGKLIGAAAVGGVAGGVAAGGLAGKALGFGKKYALKKAGECCYIIIFFFYSVLGVTERGGG